MLHSKLRTTATRLLQATRMIARFSSTLYTAFLIERPFHFLLIVIFNFLSRVFNLAAFVLSIQSIYIAFQSSASHGADFKGKQYFDMLGLQDAWLPWLLAGFVVVIFMMPGLLKVFETRLIASITKENHRFCLDHKVHFKTDLFVTLRGPVFLTYLSRFFSGALFIFFSLVIVSLFRIDLFLIVLMISVCITAIVIFSNWRQVIRTSEQAPKQAAYFNRSRRSLDPRRNAPIEEVLVVPCVEREIHFNAALGNWSRVNRTALYQVGLMGFATAMIVLFVFRIENLDESMLVTLLYLVIAIRYALNTARETGVMASKVLDLRTEHRTILELAEARH